MLEMKAATCPVSYPSFCAFAGAHDLPSGFYSTCHGEAFLIQVLRMIKVAEVLGFHEGWQKLTG